MLDVVANRAPCVDIGAKTALPVHAHRLPEQEIADFLVTPFHERLERRPVHAHRLHEFDVVLVTVLVLTRLDGRVATKVGNRVHEVAFLFRIGLLRDNRLFDGVTQLLAPARPIVLVPLAHHPRVYQGATSTVQISALVAIGREVDELRRTTRHTNQCTVLRDQMIVTRVPQPQVELRVTNIDGERPEGA